DADGQGGCREMEQGKCGNETCIDIITPFVTSLTAGTLYTAKNASLPAGYLSPVSESEFVDFLRILHQRPSTEKDDNILTSPAVFDPERVSGTRRGTGNILFLRHLWLDFENGDLPPEAVADLFPHLRMVITNT